MRRVRMACRVSGKLGIGLQRRGIYAAMKSGFIIVYFACVTPVPACCVERVKARPLKLFHFLTQILSTIDPFHRV